MDHEFDRLYAAYFGNTHLPEEEFTAAVLQYFDNKAGNPTAHDEYFNCFTVIWNALLNSGKLDQAEHVWKLALDPVRRWEQAHQGQQIHKGTAYYFWAMTALLRGGTDHGYILMHQAVQEDNRTSGQQTPDTPAYALVSLNYDKLEQAFRPWVIEQAKFFNKFVADYATTHQRPLKIEDVKRRFLCSPPSTDIVFLLTYTIARLRELERLPDQAKRNPFVGQVQLNLLFDLLLVIESAIKEKNPADRNFFSHARYLLDRAGHQLTQDQFAEVNRQFKDNFETALRAALDGTLALRPLILDRLQCDVALAYGLRNRGAHEIETVPTIWNDFDPVQQAVFRTLCATIDYLY